MKRFLFSLTILTALVAGTLGAYNIIEVPEAVARTVVVVTGQPPATAPPSFGGASDTFDRSNADALGNLSGGTYSWVESVGDIDISSNVALTGGDDLSNIAVLNPDPNLSSGSVQVYNNHGSNVWRGSGVVFWYEDSSNYWKAHFFPQNATLYLVQCVGGTDSEKATYDATALNIWNDSDFAIKVTFASTGVQVYLNKEAAPTTQRINYTTGAPYSYSGNIGIYGFDNLITLNDFSAE